EHDGMARPRFEPDIDDVSLFFKLACPTMGTVGSLWHDCIGLRRVPGIGAMFGEKLHDRPVERLFVERFAATLAQEHRNRHAPDPLARDAPVGASGNHVGNALFAPCRIPLDLLDLVKRFASQRSSVQGRFYRDEPLFRGPEDDGIVTTLAVRIRMLQGFTVKQDPARFQQLDDRLVGVEDLLAFVFGQAVVDDSSGVHIACWIELVLHPGLEVFGAMRGSRMYYASARVHGHIISDDTEYPASLPRQK